MNTQWDELIEQLDSEYQNEEQLFVALAASEGGDKAFPEDLISRGKQIFTTIAAVVGERICNDPEVRRLLNANGPRASEVMTIVPLLINLLPSQTLQETSIALAALLITRMGLGVFCQNYLINRQGKK